MALDSILNVNVGILGHVDSGKTSLVAALSTQLSTAALDKHPESRRRGITQDLGFSSFVTDAPEHVRARGYGRVQFTLVDCPGHATLIRTIIGGAQIIDVMVLVIDATKGIQTQTAECLVVGELTAESMLVVLNKADLFPESEREQKLAKLEKGISATFAKTKFAGCPMVRVSARPGGGDNTVGFDGSRAVGVEAVVEKLRDFVPGEARDQSGDFCMAVDHCFAIRGQGTVMTGTVLSGRVAVGDEVEEPSRKERFKVKSMQMFRKPVQQAGKGDRVGVCVAGLDPAALERGLACTPGSVPTFTRAVAVVEKIRFYKATVASKSKMHVTIGHATAVADLHFFGLPDEAEPWWLTSKEAPAQDAGRLRKREYARPVQMESEEYLHQDELYGPEGRPGAEPTSSVQSDMPELGVTYRGPQWVLMQFEHPVTAPRDSVVIGSRLDMDAQTSTCRLGWYGRIVHVVDDRDPGALQRLRVFKWKRREGSVERVEADGRTAICKGMFKKETNLALLQGMRVTCRGKEGRIEGPFGKSGKFKVYFKDGGIEPDDVLELRFKKFVFSGDKKEMLQ